MFTAFGPSCKAKNAWWSIVLQRHNIKKKKKIGQYDTFGKKSCKARWERVPSGCFQLNPICIVLFIVHCVAYQ